MLNPIKETRVFLTATLKREETMIQFVGQAFFVRGVVGKGTFNPWFICLQLSTSDRPSQTQPVIEPLHNLVQNGLSFAV